jgi:hypothetical protein
VVAAIHRRVGFSSINPEEMSNPGFALVRRSSDEPGVTCLPTISPPVNLERWARGRQRWVLPRDRRRSRYVALWASRSRPCYRWRREYGGLKVEQAKRLKALEQESARLKRAVAELTLDKLILQEAVKGNFSALPDAGLVWRGCGELSGYRNAESVR